MSTSEEKLLVARIGKPHGIRGEVTVQLFTDQPETRFSKGRQFSTDHPSISQLTIKSSRWHNKILLLAFEEVSDRNTAELLRNHRMFTAETEQEDDAWYEHELVGLEVMHGDKPIGKVAALNVGEAQDLLIIKHINGSEVLIPFVAEIVQEVDPEEGYITITPPPGLLELND